MSRKRPSKHSLAKKVLLKDQDKEENHGDLGSVKNRPPAHPTHSVPHWRKNDSHPVLPLYAARGHRNSRLHHQGLETPGPAIELLCKRNKAP